jgi:hypothetical protein
MASARIKGWFAHCNVPPIVLFGFVERRTALDGDLVARRLGATMVFPDALCRGCPTESSRDLLSLQAPQEVRDDDDAVDRE